MHLAAQPARLRKGSGWGSAQHYPEERSAKQPDANESIRYMTKATCDERIEGYKGCSALVALTDFDIVEGVVPDYMHGVLLGLTAQTQNILFIWVKETAHYQW